MQRGCCACRVTALLRFGTTLEAARNVLWLQREKQERSPSMKASEAFLQKPEIARRDFLRIGSGSRTDAVTVAETLAAGQASSLAAQTAAQTSDQPWNAPPRGTIRPVSVDCHTHWAS